MAKTFILKIEELIKMLEDCKKGGKHEMVLFTVGSCYEAKSPTKKKPYYDLKFSVAGDIFKKPGVAAFGHLFNIDFCGVILDKASAEHLKEEEVKLKAKIYMTFGEELKEKKVKMR